MPKSVKMGDLMAMMESPAEMEMPEAVDVTPEEEVVIEEPKKTAKKAASGLVDFVIPSTVEVAVGSIWEIVYNGRGYRLRVDGKTKNRVPAEAKAFFEAKLEKIARFNKIKTLITSRVDE